MTIPEPGQPGYPTDTLGQFRNYLRRLDDNDEAIELADAEGYFDALRPLIDDHPNSLRQKMAAWANQRMVLSDADGGPSVPPADDWAQSDDEAVELLEAIAAALGWEEPT